MPSKVIIGFVANMAAGKGTAAKYLEERYGAHTYRFSTMLFDLLKRIYVEPSRDNLINMSEIIRGAFGEDTMAKVMAKDAENDKNSLIIVEGIRRMADIEHLAKLPNFILVEIFADLEKRHERLTKRREKPDDASTTLEQFKKDHKRSTEMTIPEVASHATERIDNNGTAEELYKKLDDLINKYNAS